MISLWLWLITITSACEGYKILVVCPTASNSHKILGDGLVRPLLEDRHEVTYITPYTQKETIPKLKIVDVSASSFDAMPSEMLNISAIINKEADVENNILQVVANLNKVTMENENVQNFLKDQSQEFDLVIAEWGLTDLFTGFAALYNCPHIWFSTIEAHSMILNLVDEPTNPAFVQPDVRSSKLPPFSFLDRVKGLLKQLLATFFKNHIVFKSDNEQFEKLFGPIFAKRGKSLPSFEEVKYNSSMILANSHLSLSQTAKLPPNVVNIGGYHIDTEVKPLPQDLKNILDGAPNGLIYFSMGSILKSKEMPEQLKVNLLKVFGELKQTVLWKFEEVLPNLPPNVHIVKWAPQQSILAHPNCILFITHGGLLSVTEAIHFGKPFIGIPAFGDQFVNVDRSVDKGFAKKVELSHTTADDLKIAIKEVLSDPQYAEKAKHLSFLYHDRPVHPKKEYVHWVNHVIKTRGAPHLRSPAFLVPFYQKIYLDLLALVVLTVILLKWIAKRLCSSLCSKGSNKVNKKKKNN